MSKVIRFNVRRKKPAAKASRLKIGRDLFAVLVVGLSVGLGAAWTGVDMPEARRLVGNAFAGVRAIEPSPAALDKDVDEKLEVSSIGGKPAAQAARERSAATRYYPVCNIGMATRRNCVIDGDTFYFGGTTIRISDIDAPETHPPRCAYEADIGDRATVRLSQLLSAGAFQLVRRDRDTDKYGRQLRIVIRDGRSLGRIMVGEGLARPWTGKRRPWCGANDAAG